MVADHIATACGENGASAEYLLETVLKCEELGIHDPFLWRLQALVAERMREASEPR
jgi:glutathione-specific gamma-glutamylcyclotransferase